jgi:osmotically-inducible protein OsmY
VRIGLTQKHPMPYPFIHFHPSLESSSPLNNLDAPRPSLFDAKDDFIERMAPIGMAAIYFGGFSLAPQDPALSRQALLKLSFAHRHFLHPAGIRYQVQRQTATISGSVTTRSLVTLAEILAQQIEGITQIKDETEAAVADQPAVSREMEAVQLLLATDQSLRSQVQVTEDHGILRLAGTVGSEAQKSWTEQLVRSVGAEVGSDLNVAPLNDSTVKAALLDDESLQALVLYRLRLVRETEHLPLKVKANRGVLTLHGKVRTEALRQRVENIARATLGLRELRSSLTIAA